MISQPPFPSPMERPSPQACSLGAVTALRGVAAWLQPATNAARSRQQAASGESVVTAGASVTGAWGTPVCRCSQHQDRDQRRCSSRDISRVQRDRAYGPVGGRGRTQGARLSGIKWKTHAPSWRLKPRSSARCAGSPCKVIARRILLPATLCSCASSREAQGKVFGAPLAVGRGTKHLEGGARMRSQRWDAADFLARLQSE